mmetsp:Transcript_32418/g.97486  ORF Transcript_32418/g.97486 Transcript_32418/m.97486 type:complete len:238 (-) Transcript_32418:1048-1761(-)
MILGAMTSESRPGTSSWWSTPMPYSSRNAARTRSFVASISDTSAERRTSRSRPCRQNLSSKRHRKSGLSNVSLKILSISRQHGWCGSPSANARVWRPSTPNGITASVDSPACLRRTREPAKPKSTASSPPASSSLPFIPGAAARLTTARTSGVAMRGDSSPRSVANRFRSAANPSRLSTSIFVAAQFSCVLVQELQRRQRPAALDAVVARLPGDRSSANKYERTPGRLGLRCSSRRE